MLAFQIIKKIFPCIDFLPNCMRRFFQFYWHEE